MTFPELCEYLSNSEDDKVQFVGRTLAKTYEIRGQFNDRNDMNGLVSLASAELEAYGVPKDDGRPAEKSENSYYIYNLIDYLQEFKEGSNEKLAGNLLQQFMTLEFKKGYKRKIL